MTDEFTPEGQPAQEQLESNWWRLQGIFFEPVETFQQIARRPNVLLPLLVIAVVGLAATYFVVDQIGYGNIVRKQMEQSPSVQQLEAAQREELIRDQIDNPVFQVLTYAAPALAIIPVVVVAGLLLLGARVFGSESSFKSILSATCHSYLAQGIITSVLICLVVAVTADKQSIDTTNAVFSNPGFLVDAAESPVLYAAASSLDLLSFYLMFLLALGLSTLDRKMSFGAAAGVVLFWWALWVAGKMGLTALFS